MVLFLINSLFSFRLFCIKRLTLYCFLLCAILEHTLAEIVKDILRKLNHRVLSDYEGMIGIEKHIEKIQSLLLLEPAAVRIIGIRGMGGIGKTTIANAIYHKFSTQFSSKSIILNAQQEIERT